MSVYSQSIREYVRAALVLLHCKDLTVHERAAVQDSLDRLTAHLAAVAPVPRP